MLSNSSDSNLLTPHSDVKLNDMNDNSRKSIKFNASDSTKKLNQEMQSQANQTAIEVASARNESANLVVDSLVSSEQKLYETSSSTSIEMIIRNNLQAHIRQANIGGISEDHLSNFVKAALDSVNELTKKNLINVDISSERTVVGANDGTHVRLATATSATSFVESGDIKSSSKDEEEDILERTHTPDNILTTQPFKQSSEHAALIEELSSTGSREADHLIDMILHGTEDVFDSKYLMKLHEEYKIKIENEVNDRINAGDSLLKIARSMGYNEPIDTKEIEGHRPLIRETEENNEKYVQRMRNLARSINKKYEKMSINDIIKTIIDKQGKNNLNASEQDLDILAVNTALSLKNVYKFSDDRLLHEAAQIKNLYLNCNSQKYVAEYIYKFYKEQYNKFRKRRVKQDIVLMLGKWEERLKRLKEKYPKAKAHDKRGKEMTLLKKLIDLRSDCQKQFSHNLIKMLKELHSYDKITSAMEKMKQKYWETIVNITDKEHKDNLKVRYKQTKVAYETFKDRSSHKQRVQTQFSIKDIRNDIMKEIREKNATLARLCTKMGKGEA